VTEDTSKGKIGFFCSYVPKELIYAFGKTPVRILPTTEKASEAEAYLPRNFCSLVKITLAGFLENQSNLEAVIHADSCDALRRLNDVWRRYVDIEALHLLDLPRIDTPLGHQYFYRALQHLAQRLETRYGTALSRHNLRSAIECYNQQRRLLTELDDRWSQGLVPTEEYYELRHTALTGDPALVNARLRENVTELQERAPASSSEPRVMLVGSLLAKGELVQAVENHGVRIAAEDSCSIGRELLDEVESSGDVDEMLRKLAASYLNKPPCPRMRDFSGRLARLSNLVGERRIDGVICSYYKFCDLFMSEYPALREFMHEQGIPTLLLEDEGEATLSGQHRTRLEAFLEVLG
jgi:benzoyl-CoA reductase subunit C